MILRELQEDDIDGMLEWMHDDEINRFFEFDAASYTEEDARAFIKLSQEQRNNKTTFHWAITEEGKEYLGTISLKNIDYKNGNAEYAICLRKCAQGKGYGVGATREVLRYAKEELHLHKVYLNVLEYNKKAVNMYEKCGFTYEGKSIEQVKIANQYATLLWYGIIID